MVRLTLSAAWFVAICWVSTCCVSTSARGDRFELKGGGEVLGELVDRETKGAYVVRTPEGAQVTLGRNEVVRIVSTTPDSEEYARRSRQMTNTAESHRELAEWCRVHQMADEREHHLQRLLEFDSEDEEARLGLGYHKRGGQWVNRQELMQARGLELFEGKYRTPQEIAIWKRDKAIETAAGDWVGKLRLWRSWLDSRRQNRIDEARLQIGSIEDPMAAPSIVRMLADEQDEWVVAQLISVLGRLRHPLAIQTLVQRSLHDESPDVREQCLELSIHGPHRVSLLPYVEALKSADNEVVNRAAAALEQIGDKEAISPLIDALVTTHKYRVEGAQPGQINAGMTNGGGGLNLGGNAPKLVREELNNAQVLSALIKLAGRRDLGYDVEAWRRWFVSEQMQQHFPSRRDE